MDYLLHAFLVCVGTELLIHSRPFIYLFIFFLNTLTLDSESLFELYVALYVYIWNIPHIP